MIDEELLARLSTERTLRHGIVAEVLDREHVAVLVPGDGEDRIAIAELLVTSSRPIRLAYGDRVLCLVEQEGTDTRAVVIGRVGRAARVARSVRKEDNTQQAPEEIPDTLVLEAKRSLTLRVGEGSITIREDGKILIKGKDLVSHAQRMNRIKGGAVSIN